MLDEPTERLPTAAELELWEFDLAKRMIRDGRDDRRVLLDQGTAAIVDYVKGVSENDG